MTGVGMMDRWAHALVVQMWRSRGTSGAVTWNLVNIGAVAAAFIFSLNIGQQKCEYSRATQLHQWPGKPENGSNYGASGVGPEEPVLHWTHVRLCVQVEVIVEETVRWSLKVSRETDEALRAHLGQTGGRKGDFSRFVQDAVKARLKEKSPRGKAVTTGRDRSGLADAVQEIRAKTKSLPRARFEKLVAEAVAYARRRR